MKSAPSLSVSAPVRRLSFGASLLSLFALLSASPLSAAAQLVIANQDTYVHGASANRDMNYGNVATMQLAGRNTDNTRKIYLGFDLSGVDASKPFDEATSLSLTFASSILIGNANGVVSFNVYGVTDNTAQFDESVITWNNAPKNNTSSSSAFHVTGVTLLGTVTVDTTAVTQGQSISLGGLGLANYLNWAVGNMGDFYGTGRTQANGKKITLLLAMDAAYVGTSYPGFYFYSSETTTGDANKPHLSLVQASPIPEPSSAALMLGGGVLGAVVLRRRFRR